MFEEILEVDGIYRVDRNVIYRNIAFDLAIEPGSVIATVKLLIDNATVPFIARYRKEKTGGLNEIQIRDIQAKLEYYVGLETRKAAVLKAIHSQGCLDDGLKKKIIDCKDKITLEDIYLPFKPKKDTRAGRARDAGLAPLAEVIIWQQEFEGSIDSFINKFVRNDKGIKTAEEAISGATEIIIEKMKEDVETRAWVRALFVETGFMVTAPTKEWEGKKSKYDMYYAFREPIKDAASHRLLAIRRGSNERVISWRIQIEEERIEEYLTGKYLKRSGHGFAGALRGAIKKGAVSLKVSLEMEIFFEKLRAAETDAIDVFSRNLKGLLLEPPAGHKVILGVDPGFRTGCKLAAVDPYGNFKEYKAIFPHDPQNEKSEAAGIVMDFIGKYKVELIAVGNGTASRETASFLNSVLEKHKIENVKVVIVSESGASVYSASDVAIKEFPDLDVTVRGAISIARRLQDPLSELVKIDPKAIGVGQYQHDVSEVALQRSLKDMVESCVNFVGVEANTASKELLSYVSGVGTFTAANIVKYREENGPFKSREDLKKVPMLKGKAFEQCAGFLRIRNSPNRLDNSSIHPESYHIVERMAGDLSMGLDELVGNKGSVQKIPFKKYVTEEMGLLTLKDIKEELVKPGLDPRKSFENVEFRSDIKTIKQLKSGMKLFGKVTNVTNFGVFVDIGVHQDGLIHISNLSNKFIKDPHEVVSVGDTVRVKVLSVDLELNRIGLEKS